MKLDVGSGYNPAKGYKTCDINFGCDFHNIKEVPSGSAEITRIRNVLHHVPNLDDIANDLYRVTKSNGYLLVIECKKDDFDKNKLLDTIWYRSVNIRNEIFISNEYRNYESYLLKSGFTLIKSSLINEKEIKIFKKESKHGKG